MATDAMTAEPPSMAVRKRSVVLNGHATSISLEDAFWAAAREIADRDGISVRRLLEAIDAERRGANLSSAVRVYTLRHFQRGGGAKPPEAAEA
jgi:predicted DNA-binding ribbon-helix-helix protein